MEPRQGTSSRTVPPLSLGHACCSRGLVGWRSFRSRLIRTGSILSKLLGDTRDDARDDDDTFIGVWIWRTYARSDIRSASDVSIERPSNRVDYLSHCFDL